MSRPPLRARPYAIAVLLLGIGGAVVSALAGWRILLVSRDLNAGKAALVQVEPRIRAEDLVGAQRQMAVAQSRVLRAYERLNDSRALEIVDVLPVVHQNLSAIKESVDLALKLVDGGTRIVNAAMPLADAAGKIEVPLRQGSVPVATVVKLRDYVQELAAALPDAGDRPSGLLLLPPVRTLQTTVFDEAVTRNKQFSKLGPALNLLADMSGENGPRRYLLAIGNAAEMRGSGGMILSYGTLLAEGGRFTLDKFGGIDELDLSAPVRTPVPPDYYSQYEPMGPTQIWRNATLTADFAVAGPVLEAMYQAATGKAADGVVQIDSSGLRAILEGIGAVDVPGIGPIDATNVERVTLNEAYTLYPDRPVRQDVMTGVAEAVFRKLVTGSYPSVRPLAEALVRTAAQRHVIMHSARPKTQRSLIALGAEGYMPDPRSEFVHLTVQNVSANKLDYYLDSSLRLSGQWHPGKVGRVQAQIELTNTAPRDGRPTYVFGPNLPDQRNGEYRGWVTLYLPLGARIVGSSGGFQNPPWLVSEVERAAAHFVTVVPAGGKTVVTLDLELPVRQGRRMALQLVPSPRLRPTTFAVDLDAGNERLRAQLPLDRVRVLSRRSTQGG